MRHYSPKIDYILIKRLYELKHSGKRIIPMTKMVNEALKEYLERWQDKPSPKRVSSK